MNMVKALVLQSPDNLTLRELELPDNCDSGIVVDIIACGICGTDGHLIAGKMPINYPIIPGHEFYGVVSYIGKNSRVNSLNGEISIGDYITVLPGKSCGKCVYCEKLEDAEELCINRKTYGMSFTTNTSPVLGGGYAEKVFITEDFQVYHIPPEWPIGFGAFLETIAVGVHAADRILSVAKSMIDRPLTATILGAGAVGIAVALSLMRKGVSVSIIEPIEHRRNLALKIGVEEVFDHCEHNAEWERMFTQSMKGVKPDIVIEAAGTLSAFDSALLLVRRGGVVLELGNFVNVGESRVAPSFLCRNEIIVMGSALAPASSYKEAEEILNSLVPFHSELISPLFKLEQYKTAIHNLRTDKHGLKAMFVNGE